MRIESFRSTSYSQASAICSSRSRTGLAPNSAFCCPHASAPFGMTARYVSFRSGSVMAAENICSSTSQLWLPQKIFTPSSDVSLATPAAAACDSSFARVELCGVDSSM